MLSFMENLKIYVVKTILFVLFLKLPIGRKHLSFRLQNDSRPTVKPELRRHRQN